MARHAASKSPRHDLLQAGLTMTVVGTVLAAGSAAAQAAPLPLPAGAEQALDGADAPSGSVITGTLMQATASGFGPMKNMRLNPVAGTGVNPLDNTVGTQVADFKPVDTGVLTRSLADGGAVKDLPVAGMVTSVLPG
ncbi:hypothetical protein ACIO3O_23985 [Streptomyces sp. NPDC087440]|uniref:hypothetical protein n=1 Tax=Streptomyces sp. NPDC087440 TaxID=3365790 RepID=UPI0038302352